MRASLKRALTMFWKHLFKPSRQLVAARDLYAAIVAQSRQQGFYENLKVPDTLDGRFDLITLHAVLVMDRLSAEGDPAARDFGQLLFDEMFTQLDLNLREMGVGDLSISKRVKRMAEVFYGRAGAYRAALRTHDEIALAQALARNLYPEGAPVGAGEALAKYACGVVESLNQQAVSDIMQAKISMPPAPEANS